MAEIKKKLSLPSILESVEKAAHESELFAKECGYDEGAIYAIDMAVREAVANAVKHGNKFDESKNVEITFNSLENGFEVEVRDFGKGFEVDDIPDPTNPENLLKANGRGILFMRNFMELVDWTNHEDGGTIVKMCKLR